MKLTFGMACDGRSYPDFPGRDEGVFNAAVLGPIGLIDMLEIQLGLTGPRAAHAVRVAGYAAKLRAALEAGPELFFAASFALDPWETATSLLEWRDALVSAGWTGSAAGSERPDALARVESAGPALAPGIADRLRAVCATLGDCAALTIESIALIEPRELVAPAWRRLIEALEACGVAIIAAAAPPPSAAGDLGHAQAFLASGAIAPLQGDGSFMIVEADTALVAAEALAEWLAHGSEAELAGTVVVAADGDTALLDLALQARGLPALGQSAASPWRGALQVLPLAFAAAWAPFDARAMLDLLMLPRPPIGRAAARRLARALSREPGTGGAAWAAAWAEIEAELAAHMAERPNADQDVAARLAAWREWTTGALHSRAGGMPAEAARRIAARVAQWAIETDAGTHDPLLMTVAGAASALGDAIGILELEVLPALLVERMIDQVLADGAQNPDHVATAGGLRCVRHPAAVWDTAPRVIWWDFKGPGDRVPASPWSVAEQEALGAAGCRFEAPDACASRIGWSYANVAHRAGERLILVSPALSGGEETTSHPLAHQLSPLSVPAGRAVRWSAERLLDEAEHHLAGRDLIRDRIAVVTPPGQRARWALPASAQARLAGRTENATSFERLADCQMRWMLLDVLRLSRGRIAEIPGPDQLLGNLAHEIANHVLQPGPVADADEVLGQAEAVFDELLDAIATPLQQPEFAGELAAARVRVPAALAQLARLLRQKGLSVVGTELEREGDFTGGLAVNGRLDLIVEHPIHGLGVIDLKWTRSARRRRTELAEGRALQLATYGAIAGPAGGPPVPGAYYLLSQRRLIANSGSFLADEVIEADRTLAETWADLVTTWRSWRDLALGGTVLATGASVADIHMPADLPIAPGTEPCRYCELTGLCRVAVEAV
ncbi:PD-(D/E)XK nuclease family protein [Sphingomonas oryzagri]